jgi:hypothetical protein
MTSLQIAQFAAILTTALALVPGAAHALELPNKMRLSRIDYLIVQQVYRGWAYVGIFVVAALMSTGALALMTHAPLAYAAFALLIGTQIVFWIEVFPVNRRTRNWKVAPDGWSSLRRQWEYSHAASAALNLAALVCATLVVVRR